MNDLIYTLRLIYSKHKFLFIFLFITNILLGILPLVSVFFVQNIINNLVLRKSFSVIILLFSLYILNSLISSLLSALQSYVNGKISNLLSFEMEYEVLNKVGKLDLADFEDEKIYSEVDKLTNEAPTKPFEVFSALNTMLISVVTLISGYVYILSFNKLYALILLIITCISIPYLLYMGKEQFSIHWNRAEPERKNWYIKYIMTHDFSVKEILFYNLSTYLKKKFVKLKKKFITQDLYLLKKYSIFSFVYETVITIVSGMLIISTIWAIFLGKTLIGTLTSITQIISLTEENTQTLISNIYSLRYDSMLLGKLYKFISKDSKTDLDLNKSLYPLKKVDYITVHNLSFSYGKAEVLHNINFKMHKGMLVALVGRNGSGKSTLVKLLSGLYKVDSKNAIVINDHDINYYDSSTFHNKISILFQDFVKYEMSLRENIGFGNLANIDDDEMLKYTFHKYASSLSDKIKLDDQLGNWFSKGVQLSGGQWQGVATSRAFFNKNTDFVILDEPNSALDSVAEKKLFDEFRSFVNKDKLGLFISHRIGAVKKADLIIVLDRGRVIATGTHDQLIKNCKIYQELAEAEKYE